MPKAGKAFEELVYAIERAIGADAEVLANQYLPDKDTGKPREIDILLKGRVGHHAPLGMIEVRDRARPAGVEFVEQVATKRDSVGADFAVVVSMSGFRNSAIKKAARRGIRTISYEEAKKEDWASWFSRSAFAFHRRVYDNPRMAFFGPDGTEVTPSSGVHEDLKRDPLARVLRDAGGQPVASLHDVVRLFIDKKPEVFDGVEVGGPLVLRDGRVEFCPSLFVEGEAGGLAEVKIAAFVFDVRIEVEQVPLRMMRYRHAGADTVAEVMVADVDLGGKANPP